MATPLLEKFQVYGLSLETRMSNLKSVALAVLELLAFSCQKFRGSRDHGHAHFQELLKNICFGMLRGANAMFQIW